MTSLYIDVKKLASNSSNAYNFKFPVHPRRMAKAPMLEPNRFSSKINNSLNRVAGQIAYNEFKRHVKGTVMSQEKPKSSSMRTIEVSSRGQSPAASPWKGSSARKNSKAGGTLATEEGEQSVSTQMQKKMEFKAPQLIRFALDQIERDTERSRFSDRRAQQLSDLEKGRLVLKFMSKKFKPFENRSFFDHFFREHDKAQQIQILEVLSNKLEKIVRHDGSFQQEEGKPPLHEQLSQVLANNQSIDELNLSKTQKTKLLKQIREELLAVEGAPAKKQSVSMSPQSIIGVMSLHKLNSLFSADDLSKNIQKINDSLLPENLMSVDEKQRRFQHQKEITDRLSHKHQSFHCDSSMSSFVLPAVRTKYQQHFLSNENTPQQTGVNFGSIDEVQRQPEIRRYRQLNQKYKSKMGDHTASERSDLKVPSKMSQGSVRQKFHNTLESRRFMPQPASTRPEPNNEPLVRIIASRSNNQPEVLLSENSFAGSSDGLIKQRGLGPWVEDPRKAGQHPNDQKGIETRASPSFYVHRQDQRQFFTSQRDRQAFNKIQTKNIETFRQRRRTRGPKALNSISPSKLRHINEESRLSQESLVGLREESRIQSNLGSLQQNSLIKIEHHSHRPDHRHSRNPKIPAGNTLVDIMNSGLSQGSQGTSSDLGSRAGWKAHEVPSNLRRGDGISSIDQIATGEDLELGMDGQVLNLQGSLESLPGEGNHLSLATKPRSKKQRQIDELISNATTFIKEGSQQDKELFKFIDEESEEIQNKLTSFLSQGDTSGFKPGHLSNYDRIRRERAAKVKKENDEIIRKKYEYLANSANKGQTLTQSQREENEREMRRKIQIEKNILRQFGQIDGCLNQFDRLSRIDRLYRMGNLRQRVSRRKKLEQYQLQRRLQKREDDFREFI